jgi:NitT/TauT family transport system permease protein
MSRINSIASVSRRVLPNHWDLVALAVIMAVLAGIARAYHGISAPLPPSDVPAVSLDYWELPYYALRTALRMFAALAASFVFTFLYATLAAKSRRAEMVLIPVLDILQSVPILGFLSFTVTFFLGLFPGNVLGAECAAIFAVFTSQAWNMAFSLYQSLRTVPRDLDEVARGFRLTGWQKFWQLEAPFAVPGLIWNTMMSMSGGWFFVVAAEAITVGDTTITLPGVGAIALSGRILGKLRRQKLTDRSAAKIGLAASRTQ